MSLFKKKKFVIVIFFATIILLLSGGYQIASNQSRQFIERGFQVTKKIKEDNVMSLLGYLADNQKTSFYLHQQKQQALSVEAICIIDFNENVASSAGNGVCEKPSIFILGSIIQKTEKENAQYVKFDDGDKGIVFESLIEVGGEKLGKIQLFTAEPYYCFIVQNINILSFISLLSGVVLSMIIIFRIK